MFIDESEDMVIVNLEETDTIQLRSVFHDIFPEWAELFARKNAEYGEAQGNDWELGPRAAYVDMARKMRKLQRALWEGDESVLVSESVDEIIMDLIGHCFLILQARRHA